MRRSILHALAVSAAGFVVALSLAGCAQKESFTDPLAAAGSAERGLIPLPPRPPRPQATDFVDIVAGKDFTCARRINGKVYCWGLDHLTQTGRYSYTMCVGISCVTRPEVVMSGTDTLRASMIEAGTSHSCIIDSLSDAYCWGDASQGQLGFALGGSAAPTKVVGGLKFNTIGAGSNSTCGTTTTGLFCWGRLMGNATAPVRLTSDPGYTGMIVGDLHACMMEVWSGSRALDCWGSNTYGQVGIDPNLFGIWNAPFALRAQFGTSVTRATTEFNVTCVDQSNGTVQCAGENTWGMLGNGNIGVGYSTGVAQTVGSGQQLHGVTTGQVHACALDTAAHAWCWGNGFNGQLGNGASAIYTTPQAVLGGITFRAIAAGSQHTCGIGTDNHIYCWGQNKYGQLGGGFAGSWYWSPQPAQDPVS